jgi:hypothetical protein
METPGKPGGRIGYAPGPHGQDHLIPDVRAQVNRLETERAERRGRLLCEVMVAVYEHDAVPSVLFPRGSALDVADSAGIAAAVAQARDALGRWR